MSVGEVIDNELHYSVIILENRKITFPGKLKGRVPAVSALDLVSNPLVIYIKNGGEVQIIKLSKLCTLKEVVSIIKPQE